MIKLSVVIGVLNGYDLFEETFLSMYKNLGCEADVEFIIIDNGSDVPIEGRKPNNLNDISNAHKYLGNIRVIRNDKNVGNYPLFKQGLDLAVGEVVAFIHSDVFIFQKGWDEAVLAQFEANEKLGLVGFLGSTEIDNWGGRGGGTVSNMVKYKDYGSEAEVHGKRDKGFIIDGSVVDGLAMIFRKSVLKEIGFKDSLPKHHFYDRIMSCQVIDAGYKVGIMGIEHCHASGQTANHENKWQDTSREWFRDYYGIESPSDWVKLHPQWVTAQNNPSHNKIPDQWDYCAYLEAEYQFLKEYRDEKHLVPMVYGKKLLH